MARLFSSGFELNSTTDGVEWTTISGSPSIASSGQRSGTYAGRITSLSSGTKKQFGYTFTGSNIESYHRFYVYFSTLPSAENVIWAAAVNPNSTSLGLSIDNSGVLRLRPFLGGSVIGSTTGLTTGKWYCIELRFGSSSVSSVIQVRLDGTQFIDTTQNGGGYTGFAVGGNIYGEAQTTGDWYFDDIAVNDTSGSDQTGWPGSGKLVLALPTGAGDSAATTGVFSYINEIPPSDTATSGSTMIELDANPTNGEYNVTDSSTLGIGSSDVIKLVSVLARVREESAGTSNYTLRIKSASGGTVISSGSVDAGNATARTNPSGTTNFGTTLIRYTDPTTTVAWTPTGTNSIDNMQIGAGTTDGNPDVWVLWMGAYIEYNASPTVALNSPADTSSGSDTTPTFDFTGTDADGDSIEYQVQISTVSPFGDFELKYVDLWLDKIGSPTDNLLLDIRSTSYSGSSIGQSDAVAASSVSASESYIRFTFATPITIQAGTKYYMTLARTGARDTSNYVAWMISNTNPYSGGGVSLKNSGTWDGEDGTNDGRFKIFDTDTVERIAQDSSINSSRQVRGAGGTSEEAGQSFTGLTAPLLDKLSVTPDATFTNPDTGGDTHPFNSGENIQYQVQAGDALSAGTYYWRVRGLDPDGTNTYGSWSSTRSFTVSGGGGGDPVILQIPQRMRRGMGI